MTVAAQIEKIDFAPDYLSRSPSFPGSLFRTTSTGGLTLRGDQNPNLVAPAGLLNQDRGAAKLNVIGMSPNSQDFHCRELESGVDEAHEP